VHPAADQPDIWAAQAPITMAAHCGGAAAVVTGRQALLFDVAAETATFGPVLTLDFPQQVSAVALFEWPSAANEVSLPPPLRACQF